MREKRAKPESKLAPSPLVLKVDRAEHQRCLICVFCKKILSKKVLYGGDQGQAEIKVDAPELPYLHKLQ